MKILPIYQHLFGCENAEQLLRLFLDTTQETIYGSDYFVDFEKILENGKKNQVAISILNVIRLCKSEKKKEERLAELLEQFPFVGEVLPLLMATREKRISVLDQRKEKFVYRSYNFAKGNEKFSKEEIKEIAGFCKKSGMLKFLSHIPDLWSYVLGVEAGLNTHARKNRAGKIMESIVEGELKKLCARFSSCAYIPQATAKKIKEAFGVEVNLKKRFDFALWDGETLHLLETNYYGVSGSKGNSIAGDYAKLQDSVKESANCRFVWITDGKGWSKNGLAQALGAIEYVFNLDMLKKGALDAMVSKDDSRKPAAA